MLRAISLNSRSRLTTRSRYGDIAAKLDIVNKAWFSALMHLPMAPILSPRSKHWPKRAPRQLAHQRLLTVHLAAILAAIPADRKSIRSLWVQMASWLTTHHTSMLILAILSNLPSGRRITLVWYLVLVCWIVRLTVHHIVTQSNFANPCEPLAASTGTEGFKSGL
jgi:hypothetical protein